jgi:hypothetical protein
VKPAVQLAGNLLVRRSLENATPNRIHAMRQIARAALLLLVLSLPGCLVVSCGG